MSHPRLAATLGLVIATLLATACAGSSPDVAVPWSRARVDPDGVHVWVVYRAPCVDVDRTEVWYRPASVRIGVYGSENRSCARPPLRQLRVPLHEPLGARTVVDAVRR